MTKFASLLSVFLLLVTLSCVSMVAPSSMTGRGQDVFTEISNIARNEGVENRDVWEAYRDVGGLLMCLVADQDGGSSIIEYSPDFQFIYVIGYYPNYEGGKYIVGIVSGSGILLSRKFIDKEEAEGIASKMFDRYKTGTITTMEMFLNKIKPIPLRNRGGGGDLLNII